MFRTRPLLFLFCWSSSMWPHCLRCAPATIEWLAFWLWLAFGWLLLDLQRFCCPVLWILLIFRWNISQFRGMGLKSGRVHMTSQTVTSWRWHLNHGVDWRPLFARMPLAWPSILKSWQMVEVWCQHLNAGTQTLMAWCVCVRVCVCRGTAFRRMLCMDSCHSVSGMPWFAGDFSLMPWTCVSGHHL